MIAGWTFSWVWRVWIRSRRMFCIFFIFSAFLDTSRNHATCLLLFFPSIDSFVLLHQCLSYRTSPQVVHFQPNLFLHSAGSCLHSLHLSVSSSAYYLLSHHCSTVRKCAMPSAQRQASLEWRNGIWQELRCESVVSRFRRCVRLCFGAVHSVDSIILPYSRVSVGIDTAPSDDNGYHGMEEESLLVCHSPHRLGSSNQVEVFGGQQPMLLEEHVYRVMPFPPW